jgi:hypothetical protein
MPTEERKCDIQKAKRSQPSLMEGGSEESLSLNIKHKPQLIASGILVSINIAEL